MWGLLSILDIALSSLRASQIAVEVTSENIANSSNPNYVRKEVVLAERSPTLYPFSFGRGVKVEGVQRVVDAFLMREWREELSGLGYFEAKSDFVSRIEDIFNELQGSGISSALEDFWNAWEELSQNPSDMVKRDLLVRRAENLASEINYTANFLIDLRDEVGKEIDSTVSEINSVVREIASLNSKIRETESRGGSASPFLDEREALLRKLSSLAGVQVVEGESSFEVLLGGIPVVDGGRYLELETETVEEGKREVFWKSPDGSRIKVTERVVGGKLKALFELQNSIVDRYLGELDRFSYSLASQVNQIHRSGYGLDGSTGIDFFVPLPSVSGSSLAIAVNPDVVNDLSKIAASSSQGEPGNNVNALAIASLRDSSISDLDGMKFSDFYAHLVGLCGSESKSVKDSLEHQRLLIKGLEEEVQSVSGVNLDEEAANLVKYQQVYTASAKLVSIVDEMFKTLLNIGT